MAFQPGTSPRFGRAARALVQTLQDAPDADARAQVLRELCAKLGDEWFPFFLKLLMVIGEGAPEDHRRLLADAVAQGLAQGQPPAGTLSSWGIPVAAPSVRADEAAGASFLRRARARPLDPLSYLAVWFSQSTARERLQASTFERAVLAILRLFEASEAARATYQAKLQAELLAAADGTYSSVAVKRLTCLVEGWRAGRSIVDLAREVTTQSEPELAPSLLVGRHRFV
jgi:hypothetical protein